MRVAWLERLEGCAVFCSDKTPSFSMEPAFEVVRGARVRDRLLLNHGRRPKGGWLPSQASSGAVLRKFDVDGYVLKIADAPWL